MADWLAHWPLLWVVKGVCEIQGWSWFTQIAKFMWPTWGPPGSCGPHVGPMNVAIRVSINLFDLLLGEGESWATYAATGEETSRTTSQEGGPVPGPTAFEEGEKDWRDSKTDAIWRHRSGLTLVHVMACCLTAPSHYLNRCWLISNDVACPTATEQGEEGCTHSKTTVL